MDGLRRGSNPTDAAAAASRCRAAASGAVPPLEPCAWGHKRPSRDAAGPSRARWHRRRTRQRGRRPRSSPLFLVNRGFLVMQRITWSSPADVLERIIRYEAVHTIQGWEDLQRRVQPPDRRCYAFFHPSLVDEPLIFVEVALTREIPSSIQGVLAEEREVLPAEQATTAVFYSISNCQPGLRGISFGNFLIKQVVADLSRDLPALQTFVTLSPA